MINISNTFIAKAMSVIFWCLLLGALAYYFQDQISQKINPNQQVSSNYQNNGQVSVVLKPNNRGHYLVNGTINSQPVTFLLDTGATQISIPAHLARQLQLSAGQTFTVNTANGQIQVAATTVNSLTIAGIKLGQLAAHLNPGIENNVILLGMNALQQLDLHQQNNTLTLTQINP
ncbi:MAG: TIGR02281 family clan AA aspartic protease [Gammaproteobacteria bacterium]|nr:TIGR02281 family clan AA aspartic protease [Gammaproteobacteria bacterium]